MISLRMFFPELRKNFDERNIAPLKLQQGLTKEKNVDRITNSFGKKAGNYG